MANDDSILSAGSTLPGSTNFMRVLNNVVETQKSVAHHFASLVTNFEDHRSELRQTISNLNDEVRRNMTSLTDEVRRIHAAERSQLISQNNELLSLLRDRIHNGAATNIAQQLPHPAHVAAPVQAYNNAMSAATMFGQDAAQMSLLSHFNDLNLQSNGALSQQAAAIWRAIQPTAVPTQPYQPSPDAQQPPVPVSTSRPAAVLVDPTSSTPTACIPNDRPINITAPVVQGGKPTISTLSPPAPVTNKAAVKEEPNETVEIKKSDGFGDQFKPKPGSWQCTGCYLNWDAAEDCKICAVGKDGTPTQGKDVFTKATQPPPAATAKFGSNPTTAPSVSFGFKSTPASVSTPDAASLAKPTATSTPKFTFSQIAVSAAKQAEAKEKQGIVANAPAVPATTFSFNSASGSASPAPAASSSAAGFSFKTPDASKSIFGGGPKTTLFGGSSAVTPVQSTEPEVEKKETPGQIFGSSFMQSGGVGFSAFKGKPNIFDDKEKVDAGQKAFANLAKSKPFGQAAPAPPPAENVEEGDNENPEEYEPGVDFAPVVPLPDLIEVKTGEEDELVKFCYRAKIYRFVKELREHKEKGAGELKILYNPLSGKYRVVMRREQVHKLCANFPILKDAKLNKTESRPAVLNIVANDFSEEPNGVVEMLSIKFKNESIANDFARAFNDAQLQSDC